jgi:hypothetical protein
VLSVPNLGKKKKWSQYPTILLATDDLKTKIKGSVETE